MTNVIYLDPANAIVMNNIKGSIAYMKERNQGGKFDLQIDRETQVLRSFFNEVLGKTAA